MRQLTLASQKNFKKYRKQTRRELFLQEMKRIVPWSELEVTIAPHYPTGENGRPPMSLSVMLQIYFLEHWFSLSDPAAEEALYDSAALRRFTGVDLGRAPTQNETMILHFRYLLEDHDLCEEILAAVNNYMTSRCLHIGTDTIMGTTIIAAPSSTKNSKQERDPQMHQTRKGNQWYFWAKAHTGVDAKNVIVHSVCTSAASVSDMHILPDLLHGAERKMWGDTGCQGQTEAIRAVASQPQDMTCGV